MIINMSGSSLFKDIHLQTEETNKNPWSPSRFEPVTPNIQV